MNEVKIWERDLPLILQKFYKTTGAIFPKKSDLISLIDLAEWLLRIPFQSSRNVHISRELQRKILTPFELNGLSEIERLTRAGGNLKPYLGDTTKLIRNRASKNNDWFSSDWGLLHFHLGADFENKGNRVSRTKRVLIAKFENDAAYFIDVVNHGRGHSDVWGDVSHLEILHKNWSHLLKGGVRLLEAETIQKISASEHIKLRSIGMTVPVTIDGKVFFPEFGMSMDGSSSRAVRIAIQINRELGYAETEFRKIEPSANAFLAITKDGSTGFFVPNTKTFHHIKYPNSELTPFFSRLLSEIPLPTNKRYRDFILPKNL
jgi:hypothetical protein